MPEERLRHLGRLRAHDDLHGALPRATRLGRGYEEIFPFARTATSTGDAAEGTLSGCAEERDFEGVWDFAADGDVMQSATSGDLSVEDQSSITFWKDHHHSEMI